FIDVTLTLTNSLVGNNDGTGLTATGPTPDADGNLVGSTASPLDPLLGPLASNGGPTQTHALMPDSPALHPRTNSLGPATHPRGLLRVSGAGADMGAFEVQLVPALVVTTADDELDFAFDPNDLSLREAVALANAFPGADTISFAPALSGLPVRLTLGELPITD